MPVNFSTGDHFHLAWHVSEKELFGADSACLMALAPTKRKSNFSLNVECQATPLKQH